MRVLIIFLAFSVGASAQFGNATKLRGRNISSTAPTDTQMLAWDAATASWKPTAGGGGGSTAASSITAGTFGAGDYVFPSDLAITDILTVGATVSINGATGAISTSGPIQSGSGGAVAGAFDIGQGTLPSLGTTAFSFLGGTSITSHGIVVPSAACATNEFWLLGAPASSIATAACQSYGLFSTQRIISSLNGAASTPPATMTGTWFTGGSATTTKPHFLIEPTGTSSTQWSTGGTAIGINAPSGFTGKFLDIKLSNEAVSTFLVSVNALSSSAASFTLSGSGAGYVLPGNGYLAWGGRDILLSPANGKFDVGSSGSAALNRFQQVASTIGSGFGTSPAIAGTDTAGRVTIGSGGSATTGVVNFGLTWTTAPSCTAQDETTVLLVQATATTTTLTLTSATAWTAADKITWHCIGY